MRPFLFGALLSLALGVGLGSQLTSRGTAHLQASFTSAHPSSVARDGLVGSWLQTITSSNGSFPLFKVLWTFDTGGGVVGTASIDFGTGTKSSPTHGAWTADDAGNVSWTGHAFSLDDSGNLNGIYNIEEHVTLTDGGSRYHGQGRFEIVNGPGAIGWTPYNITAVRITNQH